MKQHASHPQSLSGSARKNLKVLAVVPSPQCFGLQNLTLTFFDSMPSWVQAHFLTTRWTDGEFNRRLDVIGIPYAWAWIGMFSRRLDWTNLRMTFSCLIAVPSVWHEFLRLYRHFRPDIVYFANHHEIIILAPILIFIRRKVVCHMHDPPPAITFQRVSFFLWRRAVGRFLFVSKSCRDRMASLGSLNDRDRVIYNGVRIAPLSFPRRRANRFTERFNWPHSSIIIGMTGQLVPQKGHEDFISGAALAYRNNPRLRFVIGGGGSKEFKLRLTAQIEKCGLTSLMAFSGWLGDAGQFYEAIDVLVLASRHDEGFGLVLAEAAERGVPAIATASGGAQEVFVNGDSTLIVPKEDPEALARAMVGIGADGTFRQRLAARARQRITENFDAQTQARLLADALLQTSSPHHSY